MCTFNCQCSSSNISIKCLYHDERGQICILKSYQKFCPETMWNPIINFELFGISDSKLKLKGRVIAKGDWGRPCVQLHVYCNSNLVPSNIPALLTNLPITCRLISCRGAPNIRRDFYQSRAGGVVVLQGKGRRGKGGRYCSGVEAGPGCGCKHHIQSLCITFLYDWHRSWTDGTWLQRYPINTTHRWPNTALKLPHLVPSRHSRTTP